MGDKKGPGYIAVVNEWDCTASGACIAICPEAAIVEGPGRLPAAVCTVGGGAPKLRPGKAEVIAEKCTGCGDCVPACPSKAIEMKLRPAA